MATERRRKLERQSLYLNPTYKRAVKEIAKNLRSLRAVRGWTQEAAAEACDVSTRLLQAVEGGSWNATLVTLCRVADGFGVGVHDLLVPTTPAASRVRLGRPKRARTLGPRRRRAG